MSANGGVPSGLTMMLKAMGIEFDPKMFKTMADAVIEIRDRLQRIEDTVNRLENGTCALCGESIQHKCKLENLGGHSIVPASPTQEKNRVTNR